MAERYNPREIERKWQARWEADGLYRTPDESDRPNWYALTMFPYTSGDLHIGHWYAMAPSDARARFRRMQGYNVLFPMGFDAFGLPAENAAIKRGIHPKTWTYDNIENMRRQLKTMGAMFDWSREVITADPEYYRWNQWWFLQFYKRGLAYRAMAPVWWCPSCQTVLANEQVVDGTCERCGTEVVKRDLEQWFFKITAYAEELLDHSGIEWPEQVITMQRNWIGKSTGVTISFALDVPGVEEREIVVFTTRPDTVYGVTFMVLAPEHPLVPKITTPDRRAEVEAYVQQTRRESEIERTSTEREKTGVFTGAYCVNRLNGERVPIFIADYVLLSYGTGAVMGVPGHDQRDFEFARKYGLPVKVVITPPDWRPGQELAEAWTGPGRMINSDIFDGQPNEEAWDGIADLIEGSGWGKRAVTYRLRDWLISRQRYWGTPIPIVYCDRCGTVPVPEDQLPVTLPEDVDFRPTGESPLRYHEGFLHTTCPQCGGPATRETDTMDTFVDSSWYFMRYLDPDYQDGPVNPELSRRWLPVDQYTGGAEHAVMHLLYARFFAKVAADLGWADYREPFTRLFNQGQILGPDGQRMSKSRGNVVAPDEQVEKWGVDAFRGYLMFLGPWDQGGPFDISGISGVSRWLHRVWSVVLEPPAMSGMDAPDALELHRWTHRTIKQVTEDLERFRFNTAIARLMEFTNHLVRVRERGSADPVPWQEAVEALLLLMAPLTPHIAEELWTATGRPYSIHQQPWPGYKEEYARSEEVTLVVQVNGKVRDRITVPAGLSEDEARERALSSPKVQAQVNGRRIARMVYVPGKLVNLVLA